MEDLFVQPHDTIRTAMAAINRCLKALVLVVDEQRRLVGTISDGDIRRAILAGLGLETPLTELLSQKQGTRYERPVVAPAEATDEQLVRLMREHSIAQLPIVDDQGRVLRLVTLSQFVDAPNFPVQAVIMAGGFGKRLYPLTEQTPKPMLTVGGTPLLERTIRRLREAGIQQINITTHYLQEKIRSHFGTGQQLGVQLNYVSEEQPLGTAGALGLVGASEDPLLVLNGDILTGVDFRAMLSFHQQRGADLTIGVRQYEVEVPYGVIEAENGIVRSLREKPTCGYLVNAGIYLLEPHVRQHIPQSQRYDMTELIQSLLAEGRLVTSFPIVEYWLDVGRHEDFEQAQQDIQQLRWAS